MSTSEHLNQLENSILSIHDAKQKNTDQHKVIYIGIKNQMAKGFVYKRLTLLWWAAAIAVTV